MIHSSFVPLFVTAILCLPFASAQTQHETVQTITPSTFNHLSVQTLQNYPVHQSSTNTSSSRPSNSTLSPLHSTLATMYIDITKPALKSPITHPVFRDTQLQQLFDSCAAEQSKQQINQTACFLDDQYNDRLTFQITYRAPAHLIEQAFENYPPKILLRDTAATHVANPQIHSTHVFMSRSTAEIVVLYNCNIATSATIALSLNLRFGDLPEQSISIPWLKNCQSGKHQHLDFGYIIQEHRNSMPMQIKFNDANVIPLIVAPADASTELFLKLQQPGAQQAFLPPYITSSRPEVTKIAVRGNHPSGGIAQGLEDTTFQVSYNCEQKGSTEINLQIGIPPFDNLTASWTKDCGGQVPKNLQIGTSIGLSNVVKSGEPASEYLVGIQHIGTAHSDEHLHLPGNQSDWQIFLTNKHEGDKQPPQASESALRIGRIAVTVENTKNVAVLDPNIFSKDALRRGSVPNSGYVVHSGQSLKMSFHFLCKREGESRIIITVPILQYENVEFGIAKECSHAAIARKSQQLVLTAGHGIALVMLLVAVIIGVIFGRRRNQKEFAPIPLTEG